MLTYQSSQQHIERKCLVRVTGRFALLLVLICTISALSHAPQCSAQYFSSVDALQTLGDIEQRFVKAAQSYVATRAQEFATYRKLIERVSLAQTVANNNTNDYLGNPINAFTLIKRMAIDWHVVEEAVKENKPGKLLNEELDEVMFDKEFPKEDDFIGAVKGLARIQEVYNLSAFDLASGIIDGVQYNTSFKWLDCFEIAKVMFEEKRWAHALEWFRATMKKLKPFDVRRRSTRKEISIEALEYMALAHFELGNNEKSISLLDEILNLRPDHMSKETRQYIATNRREQPDKPRSLSDYPWFSNYTRLCRGIQWPEPEHHKLRCKLETAPHPMFLLAPLKTEELSLDPEVSVYHGILTNEQVDKVLQQSEKYPKFSSRHNATLKVSDFRVSKQNWLGRDSSPVMSLIYRLVGAISGLDVTSSEMMQVVNYGIGGHYEAHHDCLGANYKYTDLIGDRISTNMIYLSDVEQGGYTVFPTSNLYVRPEKGALVIWYNLHRSLMEDFRTTHSGCPIIKGSKRISNIWVHSGFQEFRRPCDIDP